MAIKIEMLRCFTAVAEGGNLSDAATRLHRSPSAVSMMLKQFEQLLGTPLFESDRKNKLTPVGAFVLEKAQAELRQFDRTVTTIKDFARAEIGSVRIASVPSIAATLLPRALGQFRQQFPKVRIELRDMDSVSILRELHQEQIDVGIATAPDNLSAVTRHPLLTDAFGLVCSQQHPLAQTKGPLHWQDLLNETFIANELCSSLQSTVFRTIYENAVLTVHNTVSLLAMVKAGLGITVLPQMVVQMSPGDVVFRSIRDTGLQRQIDLLYVTGKSRSPAAIELCNTVIDHAARIRKTR